MISSIGFGTSSATGLIAVSTTLSMPAASHQLRSPLLVPSAGESAWLFSTCSFLCANSSSRLLYAALASRTISSLVFPGPFTTLRFPIPFQPDQNFKLAQKLPSLPGMCRHGFSRVEKSQQSTAAWIQIDTVVTHVSTKGGLRAYLSSYWRTCETNGMIHIPMYTKG